MLRSWILNPDDTTSGGALINHGEVVCELEILSGHQSFER
jgi:hypothetical protein